MTEMREIIRVMTIDVPMTLTETKIGIRIVIVEAHIEGIGTGMIAGETTEIDREIPGSGRVHLALHHLPQPCPLKAQPPFQRSLLPYHPQVLQH